MAEAVSRPGSALRVYQVALVLAVGWLVGRVPQLLADQGAEQSRLMAAVGSAPAAAEGVDTARLAADIAAQVAAQVANDTVARLIDAGWGPRMPPAPPQQIIIQQAPAGGRPAEATVRIVTEPYGGQQLAGLDYRLPSGSSGTSGPSAAAVPAGVTPSAPRPTAEGQAYAKATEGYAALKAGDKRKGVRLLSDAVLMAPDAPEAANWEADVKRLSRRWSVGAYTLARSGGIGDPLAASPVLGGSQSGAAVSYTLNPLGKRPVSVVGRIAAAAGPDGAIDRETAEAAFGVRVLPVPGVPVAVDVERRIALGLYSRNNWAARVSGGVSGQTRIMNRPVTLESYGEAGVVGFRASPDIYAGGQGRGATPLFSMGRVEMDAGAGVWGSAQRSFGATASRLDLGPSARFRVKPYPFTAQLDYRLRAAGNAIPGSGAVLTVAGEF